MDKIIKDLIDEAIMEKEYKVKIRRLYATRKFNDDDLMLKTKAQE